METVTYDIQSGDYGGAGAASRQVKAHLKRIGADGDAVRRAMIAAYEAEMNVVIHSARRPPRGDLSTTTPLDVAVIDDGPGIPDLDLALTEGWSTASAEARTLGFGAGLGLPNIKRNSDAFAITSDPRGGHARRVHDLPAPQATVAGRDVLSLALHARALQAVPPLPRPPVPPAPCACATGGPQTARPPLHRLHGLHRASASRAPWRWPTRPPTPPIWPARRWRVPPAFLGGFGGRAPGRHASPTSWRRPGFAALVPPATPARRRCAPPCCELATARRAAAAGDRTRLSGGRST